jgi:transketolase
VALDHRSSGDMILSRQNLPARAERRGRRPAGSARGVCAREPEEAPDLLLIGSGSVHLLVEVASGSRRGVAAHQLPIWELFESQPEAYRHQVLPPGLRARLVVEAGCRLGWERYAGHWGLVHGIDRFGESAPAGALAGEFGFTVEHLLCLSSEALARVRAQSAG